MSSMKPSGKNRVLPPHKVREIIVDDNNVITEVRLDDGRPLFVGRAQCKLHPDGKRVLVNILVEGEFAINGKPAVETFQKAHDERPRVHVPRPVVSSLLGPDGKPMVTGA